jgi:hypothetical protein
VEGITFHLHPSLVQVAGQVRVSLGGFWKLRWLKVEGAAATAACAV